MKARLEKLLAQMDSMRNQLQERVDNSSGETDAQQERIDRNETLIQYLESAMDEIENAISECE